MRVYFIAFYVCRINDPVNIPTNPMAYKRGAGKVADILKRFFWENKGFDRVLKPVLE